MSAGSVDARQGGPGPAPGGVATGSFTRRARLRAAAAARGIPLPTILTTVGVVVLTYLAGKLVYRLRDILLLMVVAGFLAVILNPLVVYVQRWVHRRGWAVTIVTLWATVVFVGLVVAFGWPLVNGLTHLAHRLPSYVQAASNGHGWIGHLVRRLHLEAWVRRNAPKLQTLGTTLAKARRRCWPRWAPSPRWSCCCCWRAPRCAGGCSEPCPRSGRTATVG